MSPGIPVTKGGVVVKAALALWLFALSFPGLGAAALRVDQPVYDFGEVTAGYVIQHAFLLTNVGDEVLHFTRAPVASCGCSYASLPVDRLAPGESVELVVLLDTADFGGRGVAKWVYVYTDAPGSRRVKLTLRGYVKRALPWQGSASSLYWNWYLLVDLRLPEEYLAGHLLGAVNLPLPRLEEGLAGLSRESPIYLYDADGTSLSQAIGVCRELGFSAVRGIMGGAAGWIDQVGDLFWIGKRPGQGPAVEGGAFLVQPQQLARRYTVVLDLRPQEGYAAGHLPGAIHVPPHELEEFAKCLPRPRGEAQLELWCLDENEEVSCRAAQLLRDMGFPDAKCLIGGLAQWRLLYGEGLFSETD